MDFEVFRQLSARTICPQEKALERIQTDPVRLVQLLHSVIGMMGELGELAAALEKHIWYCQPLDVVNILEEIGDKFWYLAEALTALGADGDRVLQANIDKLKKRFPEKYTDEQALESNRNRQAERVELELMAQQGWDVLNQVHKTLAEIARSRGVRFVDMSGMDVDIESIPLSKAEEILAEIEKNLKEEQMIRPFPPNPAA